MPGTSNFQQWNPNATNQETDAQYTADTMRNGGASNPSIYPSLLANKLFYQLSTFIAAFGQMMATKGYAVSDANLTNLATALAAVMTQADMAPYAPLASPAFTGTPSSASTPATGDSSGKLATTSFVANALGAGGTGYNPDFNSVTLEGIDAGNGGQIRLAFGNYGAIMRSDGSNWYFMLTSNGSPFGTFNALRPLTIALGTGAVTIDGTGAGTSFGATPTAPTMAGGDNSTHLATTAFVQGVAAAVEAYANGTFQPLLNYTPVEQGGGIGQGSDKVYIGWNPTVGLKAQVDVTDVGPFVMLSGLPYSFSLSNANGYQKLPTGLIIQWGLSGVCNGGQALGVGYPITFPTAALIVTASYSNNQSTQQATGGSPFNVYNTGSRSQFNIFNGGTTGSQYYFIAIGY